MRIIRTLACLLILSIAPLVVMVGVRAQISSSATVPTRARPAFDAPTVKVKTLSGTVAIGVMGKADGPQKLWATVGAHGWLVAVRADNQTLATIDHIPERVGFDTWQLKDGPHTLTLALLNSATDQELATDSLMVTIDNADADAMAASSVIPPPTASNPEPVQPSGQPNGSATGFNSRRAPVFVRRTLALPAQATLTLIDAKVSASADPLRASATLLVRSGPRLFLGLADGGIAWCAANTSKRGGTVVRLPTTEGAAVSLVADGGRIWWLTGSGTNVFAFRESDRNVTRYDVGGSVKEDNGSPSSTPPGASTDSAIGWVRRLAIVHGQPVLLGESGAIRVLDPVSGKLSDPFSPEAAGLFPAEAAPSLGDNQSGRRGYCVSTAGTGSDARTLLVAVGGAPSVSDGSGSRNRLRAWQAGPDGAWRAITDTSTGVEPSSAGQYDVTAFGSATVERDSIRLVLTDANSHPAIPTELFFERAPGMPMGAERVALGGSGVWWVARGIVFHFDPFAGTRDAFLPWNAPGMGALQALSADRDGLWIATQNKGVRRIQPGSPTSADGYDGFVRIRLGQDSATPATHRDQAIASAIEEWQGTPYLWGGGTRQGTDCSGFVGSMHRVAGVEIPRSTAEMAVSRQGKRVRDELRWGDTLIFPGHCALYVGDGRTAETVGGTGEGSVSHASVWSRTSVVVRRFLP